MTPFYYIGGPLDKMVICGNFKSDVVGDVLYLKTTYAKIVDLKGSKFRVFLDLAIYETYEREPSDRIKEAMESTAFHMIGDTPVTSPTIDRIKREVQLEILQLGGIIGTQEL